AFIGEELGLAGTLSIIGLFVAFAIHGLRIARDAPTYHGFLLATGITAMISIYAMLNIGVVIGVLPTTGLPLPFISYGGSALLWNLSGVGILAGIARGERAGSSASPGRQRSAEMVRSV
ncbi:MAG: FtsW/RodA/SpoVE family cell cycle protein, partial [Rhodospirillales bacterium]|nr:FtsW/RodA/SpoVE family cell cycle protein [Rhodospirillales bacterium]